MRANKIGFFFAITIYLLTSVSGTALAQVSSSASSSSSSSSQSCRRLVGIVQSDKVRIDLFVEQNFDRLQEAAARGSGPILKDYVSLLGCIDIDNSMSRAIQQNYQRLFDGGKDHLIDQTTQMIEGDPEIAQACAVQS